MTKTVKITSRGRYVCPDGKVLFGPTGNWFKEDTNTLKALLIGYPNIDIVERTESKKIVNISIANVNTNNESEPVSMMEDVAPVNKDADNVDEPTDEVPSEEVPTQDAPVEETYSEVQANNETAPVETPVDDTESTEEPADEVPSEDAVAPDDETPADEIPAQEAPAEAEKPVDTTTNAQAQAQSKKNKKRHNKSTEVTPKEA